MYVYIYCKNLSEYSSLIKYHTSFQIQYINTCKHLTTPDEIKLLSKTDVYDTTLTRTVTYKVRSVEDCQYNLDLTPYSCFQQLFFFQRKMPN